MIILFIIEKKAYDIFVFNDMNRNHKSDSFKILIIILTKFFC